VRSSLTTLVVLVSVIHVAAFAVWMAIRLWPDKPGAGVAGAGGAGAGGSAAVRLCAICHEPSTHLGYDGLDPDERRDPHTGRAYSVDVAHYQPLCAAH
jgi:hypothetical protein